MGERNDDTFLQASQLGQYSISVAHHFGRLRGESRFLSFTRQPMGFDKGVLDGV